MPLYTLLLAMGNPTVHHFSLDVEGAEFPILKTIPWDKVVKINLIRRKCVELKKQGSLGSRFIVLTA